MDNIELTANDTLPLVSTIHRLAALETRMDRNDTDTKGVDDHLHDLIKEYREGQLKNEHSLTTITDSLKQISDVMKADAKHRDLQHTYMNESIKHLDEKVERLSEDTAELKRDVKALKCSANRHDSRITTLEKAKTKMYIIICAIILASAILFKYSDFTKLFSNDKESSAIVSCEDTK